MKARYLPYLLIVAGLVAVGMAVRHWYHFYTALAADMRVGLSGAWHCLYSLPHACQFGQGVTHFESYELYQPWLFWFGAAMVAAGALASLVLLAVRR